MLLIVVGASVKNEWKFKTHFQHCPIPHIYLTVDYISLIMQSSSVHEGFIILQTFQLTNFFCIENQIM